MKVVFLQVPLHSNAVNITKLFTRIVFTIYNQDEAGLAICPLFQTSHHNMHTIPD